jgi:hypothetical protein
MSGSRKSGSRKSGSQKISSALFAGCLLAALAVVAGASQAAAASGSKNKSPWSASYDARYAHSLGYRGYRYRNYSGAARDRPYAAPSIRPATLPYRPEYGFLGRVPPNAITGPGYVFVPGKGILGESCDLPTSACPNEYRDIQ